MEGEAKANRYVELRELRGKLFPAWVMLNFRHYKIPEMFRDDAKDPCERTENTKKKLEKYQEFVSRYLDYRSIYKDILLYHGVGSGKTATAINIYNVLYNYSPNFNVFVLIKAALKNNPWMSDLKRWLGFNSSHDYNDMMRNIHFVHYDSPFAHRDFIEVVKKVDSSNKNVYIIDEVHNFISNVYSNTIGSGVRAKSIYDYILSEKQSNPDTRVVAMSATPLINDPFELALLFNLLRPNIFPSNESEFYELFVSSDGFNSINYKNKQVFQRRIMGLVSYYIGTDPAMYAKKNIKFKMLEMSEYQRKVYGEFEKVERGIEGKSNSNYKTLTRQACNFVFPFISERINGETRPRPVDLLLDQNTKSLESKERAKLYQQRLDEFVAAFRTYAFKLKDPVRDEVEEFLKTHNGHFAKFHKHGRHGEAYKRLYECSPKMLNICFNLFKSKGSNVVFSNYIRGEGLEIFKIYLELFGFEDYFAESASGDAMRYIEYSSEFDKDKREMVRSVFNSPENIHGRVVKVILLSPAATEGISFLNVRQIHIMEPYWNETRMLQIYGRGIRKCSHSALPMKERVVDVYRYKVTRKGAMTTDELIEKLAMTKQNLVDSFTGAMKEVAIDCELFKTDNMVETPYQCFSFPVEEVIRNVTGSVYKDDIYEDIQVQSRSDVQLKKIKVYKVQGVRQVEGGYTDAQWFWFDFDTNIFYDYEFHIPVAQAKLLESGIPERIEENTLLIDTVVPIPLLKLTKN